MRATSVRRSGQVALGFLRDEYGERLHRVALASDFVVSLREVAPMLGSSNGHLFTSFELQITSCGTPVPNRDSCMQNAT
ncbi:hypothetical protein IGI04_015803 [Brassica rapa subsp. trilocularis]|uniref:Uncharacterized protein n=1 Tax=Brassica rapa subsp. trilocularis TaxID=1813537 RepID=A0ABQ7MU26_BRACM|nr:hypothetical protein IGI04_015803 [Brassica rapa subsp. trilocularis]